MIYTGAKLQGGAVTNAHMLDLAIGGIVFAGAMTTVAPADYRAIGVAAIGAIIGGLIAARMFRNKETKEPLEMMWGISTLAGVAFSPALFDYLSTPVVDHSGQVIRSTIIPRGETYMLALSTATAMASWGTLRVLHQGWTKIVKKWLEKWQ